MRRAGTTWRPGEEALLKKLVAELVGTYGLVLVSVATGMVDEISGGRVTPVGGGIAVGLMVAAMIYTFGSVSGAHINPAVTLAFALNRQIDWKTALLYLPAQLAGAVLSSLTLYLLLGPVVVAGATLPAAGVPQSLVMEFILAFFLMAVIMAVSLDRKIAGPVAAFAIGGTVALEIIFAGPISGASMNPARSFAPALVAWEWHGHWLYWVGPICGAAAGGGLVRWLLAGSEAGRQDNDR